MQEPGYERSKWGRIFDAVYGVVVWACMLAVLAFLAWMLAQVGPY